ncbi:MAG: hypothetical protein PHQ14_01140 [Chromatiales bacterium]|jgi:hypothetical protein|nr:hypothetical protein [Chromatiales bacterium]MDX9766067.1 hypothetical protein [Ectothiorhodospiraceae bacterium]
MRAIIILLLTALLAACATAPTPEQLEDQQRREALRETALAKMDRFLRERVVLLDQAGREESLDVLILVDGAVTPRLREHMDGYRVEVRAVSGSLLNARIPSSQAVPFASQAYVVRMELPGDVVPPSR